MKATIRFFGAARNVTGSRYILDYADRRIMIDCGMYQERELRSRNFDPFPVPADTIDAILLTHAHLDHCGYIPRLVKEGFKGPIYATPASVEIAKIVLADSGRIQEEDAARKARRHRREKRASPRPVEPMYTEDEARKTFHLFQSVPYRREFPPVPGITATFRDAGHIFGSSMLVLAFGEGQERRTVIFSGDVGRPDRPILRDPTVFDAADYIVVESTYGDRDHGEIANVEDELAREVNNAVECGGNLVIPTFAVERAHELLYYLNELLQQKRIPSVRAFLDSPMAIEVTKVFERHEELYDEGMARFIREGHSPFKCPGLSMTTSADESKRINDLEGTSIIMAGSGMCTGGRIKHHIAHNIGRPESTILFVGYQGRGTLGRIILSRPDSVRIFGKSFAVRARVAQVHGFSGHADRGELLAWVSHAKGVRRVIVTHGEAEAAAAFGELVSDRMDVPTSVPAFGESIELD